MVSLELLSRRSEEYPDIEEILAAFPLRFPKSLRPSLGAVDSNEDLAGSEHSSESRFIEASLLSDGTCRDDRNEIKLRRAERAYL